MRRPMRLLAVVLGLAALPALAADPVPEIHRDPATAQAVGAAHTLRAIPEACARLEGMFTGEAAQPYRFNVVKTSPNCQPRARLVDAGKAKPSQAKGWTFNDLIRVPSAACPSQQAVVRVWHKAAAAQPPALDGQGRARVYLQDSKAKADAGALAAVPTYAVAFALEGKACH